MIVMKQTFLDSLAEVKVFQRPYELQPAASAETIATLINQAATKLNYSPPAFYLELLQLTDGIARNGIQIYGTHTQKIQGIDRDSLLDGLVEANLVWREFTPNKSHVFFAESGSDLYQHNLETDQFEVTDRVGRTVFNVFATVEELFETIFNHMLDRYDGTVETES